MKSEFNKLTKAEKRIAIAKDVIMAIDAQVYKPNFGCYIDTGSITKYHESNVSLQSLLLKGEVKECQVCALGACFLSIVKFTNKFTIGDLSSDEKWSLFDTDNKGFSINGKATNRLREIFGKKQLALIEVAFEQDIDFAMGVRINQQHLEKAFDFCRNVEDKLLKSIMENIIANNGEFIPI